MNKEEIKFKVIGILNDLLELRGREPLYQEDLSQIGLDSLKSVNLVVEIEELFNIVFEDEELLFDNFSTLERVIDRIQGKLVLI